MVTIGEEINEWIEKYNKSDIVGKYLMHTILLLNEFKIKKQLEYLKTQPEITKEQFNKALNH